MPSSATEDTVGELKGIARLSPFIKFTSIQINFVVMRMKDGRKDLEKRNNILKAMSRERTRIIMEVNAVRLFVRKKT